ncbi:MAG TPA: hypothetical protein VK663_03465 [Burkholderiales bacterium]|nr:hypothetical protein [Burkholderiales bacterium]
MIDRATRRLLVALGASALLHVWFVQTGQRQAQQPRVSAVGGVPITAMLHVAPNELAVPDKPQRNAPERERKPIEAAEFKPGVMPVTASFAVERAAAQRATKTVDSAAHLTQPNDPTYYAARSLDVYPRAITALSLGTLSDVGKVRAMVLIDESGSVNDVRTIEANSAVTEIAARELL